MYLQKIEIQGFKSFADRTIIHFPEPTKDHHTVTIIVGPNGSGKSNVSDAIRWVLGEQSMKQIRGKKSEDVIFSGSEKRAKLGFAQVSLYLNNEDKKAPIEYDELVITRRLYRDGQSEYLLNKNPIRLFDINLLLAKAHFGQKSFSIIGQGMIDSVLLATPLERKGFFDEAVGVKEHQIKRQQALNKLERTEDNLTQANLLIKEITPQLRSLTRQVERLEKREALQATLREIQQEYYHRIYTQLDATTTQQRTQVNTLQKELDVLQEQLQAKQAEIQAIEQEASRSQVFHGLQQELQKHEQERNRLLREMTVLKGRKELALEQQGKLDLAWLYRQEEEVSSRLMEAEKGLATLKQEHAQVADEQKDVDATIARLQGQIDDLNKQVETTKQELAQAATKGPFSQIKRFVKEVHVVFEKFAKLSRAEQPDKDKLNAYAQAIEEQLHQLSRHIDEQVDGLKKEEDIAQSESQELWHLQQEINTLVDEYNQFLPKRQQNEVKAQVLAQKERLQEQEIATLKTELARITSHLQTQQAQEQGESPSKQMEEEQAALEKQLRTLDEAIAKAQEAVDAFNKEEEQKQSRVFSLERELQSLQQQVNRLQQKQNTVHIELARSETKLEDLQKEIIKELDEITVVTNRPDNTETTYATLPTEQLFSKIEKTKYQLELIGGIDPETVEEYKQVKERHDFLSEQVTDLETTLQKLEQIIKELDQTISKQFDSAFSAINREFDRYFQILFGGGRAKLIKVMSSDAPDGAMDDKPDGEEAEDQLEDAEDEKASRAKRFKKTDLRGIDIYASPAGKRLSSISMLSGGERSLTSLALIAAIIHHNPSPFILMDEVDAALDEANSQRMAKVLDELRKLTQFVIITHNRTIMNIADAIYGVTMSGDGVSKLLSVKLEEIDKHTTRL